MNQHLLNCLGVGHEKLNQISEISRKYSCPSKLTGAGGGGCALVMIPYNEGNFLLKSLLCSLFFYAVLL